MNEKADYAVDQNDVLSSALRLLLDQVDYTAANCRVNDLVGAVLDRSVLDRVRAVLVASSTARMNAQIEKPVVFERKNYTDGSSACGQGPLPNRSPDQQIIQFALERARDYIQQPDPGLRADVLSRIERALNVDTMAEVLSSPVTA